MAADIQLCQTDKRHAGTSDHLRLAAAFAHILVDVRAAI